MVAEVFLGLGASAAEGDEDVGCLPIHYAAVVGAKPIFRILHEAGADLEALDKLGRRRSEYEKMFEHVQDNFSYSLLGNNIFAIIR